MRNLICSLSFFACAAWLMMSCTNPADSQDTTFTMWHRVVSPAGLPDTLHYGQSVTFQVAIGDSDGDPVSATLSGLPPGSYNITSSGDTSFVTMNLVGDSLQYDSLYSVRVSAGGGAAVDSLSLSYSFVVVDSTRLGGLRKLVTGMWWTSEENDTIVSVKDSVTKTVIVTDTRHHHKYSTVVASGIIGGELYYYIETTDTVVADTAHPQKTGMLLRHTAAQVDYTIPPHFLLVNKDTIKAKVFDLPFRVNKSWQMFTVAGDTAIVYPVGKFPLIIFVKLHIYLAGDAQAQVAATSDYQFGGAARKCFDVVSTETTRGTLLSDTTIILLGDTLVRDRDTVLISDSLKTEHQFVNNDLSIPLYSYSVSAKRDTNYIDHVVIRDTVRTRNIVTSYYDTRTKITLTK
jgi:hypothetical protein